MASRGRPSAVGLRVVVADAHDLLRHGLVEVLTTAGAKVSQAVDSDSALRMVAEGRYVEPSDDEEHPDVIDDAVDDLIERVMQAGGFVSVVPDGTLREHGRVAMTLAR